MQNNAKLVLVVEDEPLVRLAAVEIIEEAGYSVVQASDADEAIEMLERHPEIAILFTDIEMPGSMNGLSLAVAARRRWPPVEVLLTSGRVIANEASLPPRGVFLPKPYRAGELTRQLSLMAV